MATLLAPSRTDRAFERLYRRYVADVYRYVLAVLQNRADAEDAAQTVFLSAYRAYERGERPERPLNWLIAIAHNVCRQRFRESARRPRLVELADEVPARPSDEETPNAEDIRRALGFLAFNQRAALVMRELQGRSYEEIATILGLSTSAVETLLFRARRAMREQLEGALTCGEAELALSRRADGRLTFAERGPLRAHLRECQECASLERRVRLRRRALRSIGLAPVPSSLGSFFGGGAVGTGAGIGAKAAAVVAAGALGSGLAGGDPIPSVKADPAQPARAATAGPGATAVKDSQGIERSTSRHPSARRVKLVLRLPRRSPTRTARISAPAAGAAASAAASSAPPPPSSASAEASTAPPTSDPAEPAASTNKSSEPTLPIDPVETVSETPTVTVSPASPPPAPPAPVTVPNPVTVPHPVTVSPVAPPAAPPVAKPVLPELPLPSAKLPEPPHLGVPVTATVPRP